MGTYLKEKKFELVNEQILEKTKGLIYCFYDTESPHGISKAYTSFSYDVKTILDTLLLEGQLEHLPPPSHQENW